MDSNSSDNIPIEKDVEDTGEVNFLCNFAGCQKNFKSEKGLKIHKSVHKKELNKLKEEEEAIAKDSLLSNSGAEESSKMEPTSSKRQRKSIVELRKCFCDFADCKKSFSTEFGLNVHKRTHKIDVAKEEEETKEDHKDSSGNYGEKSEDEAEEKTATSLLEAENIIKSDSSVFWSALTARASIHPNEIIVFWTDKVDESHLDATAESLKNVVICAKKIDIQKFIENNRRSLTKAYLSAFPVLESEDTFSQWTTIHFDARIDLSKIDQKVHTEIENVEEKLGETADKMKMDIINMMEFGDNEFFVSLVQKLSKKILVFNCPE